MKAREKLNVKILIKFFFFPECTVTQFECSCGSVRCIDGELLKDGRKDCEDGSDESGPLTEKLCPNGSAVRLDRAVNRTVTYPTYSAIARCPNPSICNDQLGEICIVSDLKLNPKSEKKLQISFRIFLFQCFIFLIFISLQSFRIISFNFQFCGINFSFKFFWCEIVAIWISACIFIVCCARART